MIATTSVREADIDVALRDATGVSVADLTWRADEQTATWQARGITSGEFEAALAIDNADETLYGLWLAADRADQASSGEVTYGACYGLAARARLEAASRPSAGAGTATGRSPTIAGTAAPDRHPRPWWRVHSAPSPQNRTIQ
jgi:hypothetical protein